MTACIKLASGAVVVIDDLDLVLVQNHKWHTSGRYARADFINDKGARSSVYMHRFILNPPLGMVIDHINGNGLDNTRGNLRICTPKENSRNRTDAVKAKSGFRGVGFLGYQVKSGKRKPRKKPWYAIVMVDRCRIRGGYFSTPEAAARRRDEMAIEHHGAFAFLNFPEERAIAARGPAAVAAMEQERGLSHGR